MTTKTCKKGLHQYDPVLKACPECSRITKKAWAIANPEKVQLSRAVYVEANKEKIKEQKDIYVKENLEKVKASKTKWRQNNLAQHNAGNKVWRENNPEKAAAAIAAWNKNNPGRKKANYEAWIRDNPDKVNALAAKYKAAKIQRTPSWLTDEHDKKTEFTYTLVKYLQQFSEENLHVDHVIPLQGKNVSGLHVHWNLQILTESENTSKGNKFDGTYDNESWKSLSCP